MDYQSETLFARRFQSPERANISDYATLVDRGAFLCQTNRHTKIKEISLSITIWDFPLTEVERINHFRRAFKTTFFYLGVCFVSAEEILEQKFCDNSPAQIKHEEAPLDQEYPEQNTYAELHFLNNGCPDKNSAQQLASYANKRFQLEPVRHTARQS